VGGGELELLFQPRADAATRTVVGAEALLRLRYPDHTLLAPDQFMALAEETGTIVHIGEWAIREACMQLKKWRETGYPLTITVNLSDRQFHQPDLIEKIAGILAETGLDPHVLELELTEDTLLNDLDFSVRSIHALTEMGVAVGIDRFGGGLFSLRAINKTTVNKVKIDRSFVTNIANDPYDLAAVNAVVSLSHNLKMKVAANGVETEEQLSVIRKSGCDEVQGYVISEPLPSAVFERLVYALAA